MIRNSLFEIPCSKFKRSSFIIRLHHHNFDSIRLKACARAGIASQGSRPARLPGGRSPHHESLKLLTGLPLTEFREIALKSKTGLVSTKNAPFLASAIAIPACERCGSKAEGSSAKPVLTVDIDRPRGVRETCPPLFRGPTSRGPDEEGALGRVLTIRSVIPPGFSTSDATVPFIAVKVFGS